jgi:hypothetical protein
MGFTTSDRPIGVSRTQAAKAVLAGDRRIGFAWTAAAAFSVLHIIRILVYR